MAVFDLLEHLLNYIQFLVLLLGVEDRNGSPFPKWWTSPLLVLNALNLDVGEKLNEANDPLHSQELREIVPASLPLDMRLQFTLIAVLVPLVCSILSLFFLADKLLLIWFLMVLVGSCFAFAGGLSDVIPEPLVDDTLTSTGNSHNSRNNNNARFALIIGLCLVVLSVGVALYWLFQHAIRSKKVNNNSSDKQSSTRRSMRDESNDNNNTSETEYFLVLQDPIPRSLTLAQIRSQQTRESDIGGQILRVIWVAVALATGLAALGVYVFPFLPFFGGLGYTSTAVGSVLVTMAVGGIAWGVAALFQSGREKLWNFVAASQNFLLSMLLLMVTGLFVPVITSTLLAYNCVDSSSCPAGYRLPDPSNSLVKFNSRAAFKYPTSSNFTVVSDAPRFCQPMDSLIGLVSLSNNNRTQCEQSYSSLSETSRLYGDRTVQCTSSFRLYFMSSASLQLITFAASLVALQVMLTRHATHAIEDEYPLDARQSIGLDNEQILKEKLAHSDNVAKTVYGPFLRRFRYWRLLMMLQRFFASAAGVLYFDSTVSPNSVVAMSLSFVLHLAMLAAYLVFHPFKQRSVNWLAISTQVMICIVAILGIAGGDNSGPVSDSAAPGLNETVAVFVFLFPIVALIVGLVLTQRDEAARDDARADRVHAAIMNQSAGAASPNSSNRQEQQQEQHEPEIVPPPPPEPAPAAPAPSAVVHSGSLSNLRSVASLRSKQSQQQKVSEASLAKLSFDLESGFNPLASDLGIDMMNHGQDDEDIVVETHHDDEEEPEKQNEQPTTRLVNPLSAVAATTAAASATGIWIAQQQFEDESIELQEQQPQRDDEETHLIDEADEKRRIALFGVSGDRNVLLLHAAASKADDDDDVHEEDLSQQPATTAAVTEDCPHPRHTIIDLGATLTNNNSNNTSSGGGAALLGSMSASLSVTLSHNPHSLLSPFVLVNHRRPDSLPRPEKTGFGKEGKNRNSNLSTTSNTNNSKSNSGSGNNSGKSTSTTAAPSTTAGAVSTSLDHETFSSLDRLPSFLRNKKQQQQGDLQAERSVFLGFGAAPPQPNAVAAAENGGDRNDDDLDAAALQEQLEHEQQQQQLQLQYEIAATRGWRRALLNMIAAEQDVVSKSTSIAPTLLSKRTREFVELQRALEAPTISAADEKKIKRFIKEVFGAHAKGIEERQAATDYRVNRDMALLLQVFFMVIALMSLLSLGITAVGLSVTQREERHSFLPPHGVDEVTLQHQYNFTGKPMNSAALELAGFRSWQQFTDNCCCTAFVNQTGRDILAVEKWLCPGGLVKERARKTVKASGLDAVRGMCEATFRNGCAVSVSLVKPHFLVSFGGCDTAAVTDAEKELW